MPSISHPFDPQSVYSLTNDGHIMVRNGERSGIFTREGIHVSGEIRQADPQLCVWVGNNPDPMDAKNPSARSSIMAKRK